MRKIYLLMFCSLFLSACGLLGGLVGNRSMYEEPAFTTLDTVEKNLTIRQYGPRLIAEVVVENPDVDEGSNDAFRLLFDYISGENVSGDKVAMTVPVEMEAKDNGKTNSEKIAMTTPVDTVTSGTTVTMRFFFPEKYTLETAPKPKSDKITLKELEGETLAVLRMSGTMDTKRREKESVVLREALAKSDWAPQGETRGYYYDPPFTIPPLRRVEVVVPVTKRNR